MRLAEVIGALTLAADVSNGLAVEKTLRTVLVATRLARVVAGDRDATAVYWVSALRAVGCLGFAPEQAGFRGATIIACGSPWRLRTSRDLSTR